MGGGRRLATLVQHRRSLSRIAVSGARAALDLFLPRACVCCDSALSAEDHALVCAVCLSRIVRLPAPQCDRCGHPTAGQTCRWCLLLPPFVRCARSVCWVPVGLGGDLVHKLKYDGWTRLAEPLGDRMARLSFPRDVVEERGMMVAVPLAHGRLRERGYNQSTLLAERVGTLWRVPVVEALARRRTTESQTRLTPEGRLRNVAGAFEIAISRGELTGRHVILVDDVVTTAATLNACAAALHAGGARIVSYITFGRARAAGDAL